MKRRSRIIVAIATAGAMASPVVMADPASAVTSVRDIRYEQFTPVSGGSDWLYLDVYIPDSPPPPQGYPVVVAIHGARDNGSKRGMTQEATTIAGDGFLTIAPDYRLTCSATNPPPNVDPKMCGFNSPAQIQDLEYLMDTWLPANIGTYQGNINEVGAYGTSAGATYAMLLGTLNDGHTKPAVVAALSAETRLYLYTLSPAAATEGPKDTEYIGCSYPGEEVCNDAWYAASPYDQVSGDDSPMYFSNARYEIMPWETAQDMSNALTAASVPYVFRTSPGAAHADPNVVVGPNGTTVMDEVLQFLEAYLKPGPSADLDLAATATPDGVSVGAPLTYTLTVTNNGPQTAVGLTLTDTMPPGVALTSVTPSQGSCSGTSTITCSLGSLPFPSTATVSIVSSPTSSTSLTDTASVVQSGPSTDPVGSNNSVTLSTTSVPQVNADLRASVTDSPDPVKANASLTYVVTARNRGPNAADDVVLTDSLPHGATFVSATPSQGSCNGPPVLSCSLGTLPSSSTATVTFVITQGEKGTAKNTVSVAGNVVEPTLSDNSATAVTTVQGAPQTVYVTSSDTGYVPRSVTATEGQTVQWTVPMSDAWGHGAAEADGFDRPLFDPGVVYPGGFSRYLFFAAGRYTIYDVVTRFNGTVKVGMTASPESGGTGTSFGITWASQTAPAGYLYDVQIKRPNDTSWSDWHTMVTFGNIGFVPDAGSGTYQFRARLSTSTGSVTTGWSTPKVITVS